MTSCDGREWLESDWPFLAPCYGDGFGQGGSGKQNYLIWVNSLISQLPKGKILRCKNTSIRNLVQRLEMASFSNMHRAAFGVWRSTGHYFILRCIL